MITYRLAKLSDAKSLAKVHKVCAETQKGGFFHNLGLFFLTEYYKIELSNKYSFVLIAENEIGICQGFHSGTLEAEEHFKALKNKRIRLALTFDFKNDESVKEFHKKSGYCYASEDGYICFLQNKTNFQ